MAEGEVCLKFVPTEMFEFRSETRPLFSRVWSEEKSAPVGRDRGSQSLLFVLREHKI